MHVFNGTVPMSDLSPAGPKKTNKKTNVDIWRMMKQYNALFRSFISITLILNDIVLLHIRIAQQWYFFLHCL